MYFICHTLRLASATSYTNISVIFSNIVASCVMIYRGVKNDIVKAYKHAGDATITIINFVWNVVIPLTSQYIDTKFTITNTQSCSIT